MNTVAPAFLTDALPSGAAARLAVFGKHPAAADHLEDAGLATTSLVQFKQSLYVDGLGEILARKRWEKELESLDYVPWSHAMVCAGPAGWLAAYFTASSDAKGRRQYPLVAAGHIGGFRSAASAAEAGEIIRQTLRQAQGAGSVDAIRTAQASGQRQLEEKMSIGSSAAAGSSVRLRLLEGSACPPESDALARVLHSLSPQGAGTNRARVRQNTAVSPFHALLWAGLVRSVLHLERHPVCVTWQQGEPLCDITLGDPGARTLQNLFATEAAVGLTASVPYSIDGEHQKSWNAAVQTWLEAPDFLTAPAAAAQGGSVIKNMFRSVGGLFRPKHK
ncbi:MAG TPA: hypothetical protein VG796_06450 [Verrucomicrobiales bacterium]|jgi:hypothetical protein|nr:hypothetical protein [Verrucomicrobiales bacterium]